MSTEMDKGLMALMGIEEGSTDIPQDNQDTAPSFFDSASDSDWDSDLEMVQKTPTKPAAALTPTILSPAGPSGTRKQSTQPDTQQLAYTLSRVAPEAIDHLMAEAGDDDDDDLLPPMESILQKPMASASATAASTAKPRKRLPWASRMKNKSGEKAPFRTNETASVDIPTIEYNTLSYQPSSLSLLPSLDNSMLDSQATQELRDDLRDLLDQDGGQAAAKRPTGDIISDDDGDDKHAEPKGPAPISKREQRRLQAARDKEMLEIQREREQLIRNQPLPVQQRVAKKFTIASFIEKAKSQPLSATQPQQSSSGDVASNRPAVISLLDTDSEEEKWEREQKKRVQVQSFLMNPLSKSMQKMRIDPPVTSSSVSPTKSPTKPSGAATIHRRHAPGQAPVGVSIEEFNRTMRRQLAKHNLRHRLETEADARKMGIWKSPEEYAAEQVLAEDALQKENEADAGEDGDDEEEDGDYDPDNGDGQGEEDDQEMDYGSADEEEIELAKAKKQNEMVDDEAQDDKDGGLEGVSKVNGEEAEMEEGEDDGEEEEETASEGEEDDMVEEQIQRRKPGRRRNIIGDDDDINIVVVHSKEQPKTVEVDEAALSSDLPESDISDGEADPNGMQDEDNSDDNTQSSISGALAFLSGNFGTQTTQKNRVLSPIISPGDASGTLSTSIRSDDMISPSIAISASLDDEQLPPAQPDRNAFDVLRSRMRRLEKREQKQKESFKGKSDYIEYEAEEEDDEFKGMGGVDYESDIDQDDYDMDDGMIDHGVKLKVQDVEAVRKLHMEQEQAQHDKDVSELVHGIAAGNLWKRRSGRGGVDDFDLLDTDDEDEAERRRRIKKLKVSEKFERLADNPQTAAFARAFEKNIGDEELMFATELVDSDEEEKTIRKLQMRGTLSASMSDMDSDAEDGNEGSEEEDELMKEAAAAAKKTAQEILGNEENEEDEETLNMDKRRERLVKARVDQVDVEEHGRRESVADMVDVYEATLKSRRMVDNLLRGHDENLEEDPDLHGFQDSFSTLDDRIVDRTSHDDVLSTTGGAFATRNEETLEYLQIGQRRRVARTNSSFTVEERRKMFLSTVSEDSRGGNASSRMVKEVNRRKVAFRSGITLKKTEDDGGSATTLDVDTLSVSTETKTKRAAPPSGSILLSALGGSDF